MDDILTLAEAADDLGVSPGTLRNQVLAGKLAARKVGKTWITTRTEVARYRAESLGQPGRRPKRRRRNKKWSEIRRDT